MATQLGRVWTWTGWPQELLSLEDCRDVEIKWHLFSPALIDETLNRKCTK